MSYVKDKLPSLNMIRYLEFYGRGTLQNSDLLRISVHCKCESLQDPDIITGFFFFLKFSTSLKFYIIPLNITIIV